VPSASNVTDVGSGTLVGLNVNPLAEAKAAKAA
jgi:hypothetical protein